MNNSKDKTVWDSVKEIMGNKEVLLGQVLSYQFTKTPRRILYSSSYYKFASRLIGSGKRVLDIGCGEGLGTWLLATECGCAKGIDMDKDAIEIGRKNWNDARISFECGDFMQMKEDKWDAVVAFDVVEHILPENTRSFFQKITDSLLQSGIAVIGTPNITSEQYASAVAKAGHVNLYSGERLEEELRRHFRHVFMFGANDEMVHTGFMPMSHYLIGVACRSIRDWQQSGKESP